MIWLLIQNLTNQGLKLPKMTLIMPGLSYIFFYRNIQKQLLSRVIWMLIQNLTAQGLKLPKMTLILSVLSYIFFYRLYLTSLDSLSRLICRSRVVCERHWSRNSWRLFSASSCLMKAISRSFSSSSWALRTMSWLNRITVSDLLILD